MPNLAYKHGGYPAAYRGQAGFQSQGPRPTARVIPFPSDVVKKRQRRRAMRGLRTALRYGRYLGPAGRLASLGLDLYDGYNQLFPSGRTEIRPNGWTLLQDCGKPIEMGPSSTIHSCGFVTGIPPVTTPSTIGPAGNRLTAYYDILPGGANWTKARSYGENGTSLAEEPQMVPEFIPIPRTGQPRPNYQKNRLLDVEFPQSRQVGNSVPDKSPTIYGVTTTITSTSIRNRIAPYRAQKPSKRVRERKHALAIDGRSKIGRFVSTLGEASDFIGSFHGALPEKLQRGDYSTLARLKKVILNVDQLDTGQVLKNLILNEIEDRAYGALGKQVGKVNRKRGSFAGLTLGPAL